MRNAPPLPSGGSDKSEGEIITGDPTANSGRHDDFTGPVPGRGQEIEIPIRGAADDSNVDEQSPNVDGDPGDTRVIIRAGDVPVNDSPPPADLLTGGSIRGNPGTLRQSTHVHDVDESMFNLPHKGTKYRVIMPGQIAQIWNDRKSAPGKKFYPNKGTESQWAFGDRNGPKDEWNGTAWVPVERNLNNLGEKSADEFFEALKKVFSDALGGRKVNGDKTTNKTPDKTPPAPRTLEQSVEEMFGKRDGAEIFENVQKVSDKLFEHDEHNEVLNAAFAKVLKVSGIKDKSQIQVMQGVLADLIAGRASDDDEIALMKPLGHNIGFRQKMRAMFSTLETWKQAEDVIFSQELAEIVDEFTQKEVGWWKKKKVSTVNVKQLQSSIYAAVTTCHSREQIIRMMRTALIPVPREHRQSVVDHVVTYVFGTGSDEGSLVWRMLHNVEAGYNVDTPLKPASPH